MGFSATAIASTSAANAGFSRWRSTRASIAERATTVSNCPQAADVYRISGLKRIKRRARRDARGPAPAAADKRPTSTARQALAAITGALIARLYTNRFGSRAYDRW